MLALALPGALFLSVNAWTASAAPASTPAPDRYMQFIDENDNRVCDNKENGTYVQQPNCVKEETRMEMASAAGAISIMRIIKDIVIRDVITDA